LTYYCPGRVAIKWPNDILIDGKKICGILTEMKSSSAGVEFIILGIGININMVRSDFDDILQDTATSLKIETGADLDRLTVAGNLFAVIEKWYRVFVSEGFKGIRSSFLSYTNMVGKQIRVVFRDDIQTGVAAGIDDDGTILMKDEQGVIQRVTAGDVFITK
ncbi:MAG: biotin--[acetyl-CoA-carboxylase] ligase, partial [Syntrophales bacterium]|nr:biotin--[acetyl-CoA-carboxylase] ligase [Syntrophales bacterium]